MSASVLIEIDHLYADIEVKPHVEVALQRALNRMADLMRTKMSRVAREQVNFPATYVSPSAKRLWVAQRARRGKMSIVIEGRGQATSLARFTKQKPLGAGQRHKGGKITVEVKPGRRRAIPRAFLMNLRGGNVGLAVRTEGGPPKNAFSPKLIGKNLYLLYGPSVDQALSSARHGGGIFEEVSDEALDALENEFHRQLELLENG